MSRVRFQVDPRDVPPQKAARRLGLTEDEFDRVKGRLFARGFPRPDPDTCLYDIKAVDDWMDRRSGLASIAGAKDARGLIARRLGEWNGGV